MRLFILYLKRDWEQASKPLSLVAGVLLVIQAAFGFSSLFFNLAMISLPQAMAYLCMNTYYGTNDGLEYQFSLPAPRLLPVITGMSLTVATILGLCLLVIFAHIAGLEGALHLTNDKPDSLTAATVLAAMVMAVISGCWAWLPFLARRDGLGRKTMLGVVYVGAYVFLMCAFDPGNRGVPMPAVAWLLIIAVSTAVAMALLARFRRVGIRY